MTKRAAPKYAGILEKPYAASISPKEFEKAGQFLRERMHFLLDHYGISHDHPDRWLVLSLMLAGSYVPGFRMETRGRPRKWSDSDNMKFIDDVLKLTNRGHPIRNACRILSSREPYKSNKPKDAITESLRQRYYDIIGRI